MKRKNVLIIFAAMVLSAMVGSTRISAQKSDYIHHCEWENEALKSKIIYKHSNGRTVLIPCKRGDFIYDVNNHIRSKNVYYWNRMNKSWEKEAVYAYHYVDGMLMVEMSKYEPGFKNKRIRKERCVYEIDEAWNLLSYRNYNWDEKRNLWVLTDEITIKEPISLLGNEEKVADSLNKLIIAMH
jgi:hypothetical protein